MNTNIAEELKIHAVGSYSRVSRFGYLTYRFYLDVKVTDLNGTPIEGLSADNFTIIIPELTGNLGRSSFTLLPSHNLFPGFYKLLRHESAMSSWWGWDYYHTTGVLLRVRVDYQDKFAMTVISPQNISI